MARSYAQLQQKIEALQREAEEIKAGAAKYSNGQGHTWSGKGKRPNWLREAIASGRGLEEFASSPAASPKAARSPKGAKSKKRATRVLFQDGAGNTWSGMGPRPRWLKEAVASGRTEESLRVAS